MANSRGVATDFSEAGAQIPPRWPPAPEGDRVSAPPASACEPYRAWIEAQVVLGRNATSIFQDLVEIVSLLNSTLRSAMEDGDVQQRILQEGGLATPTTPEAFAARIKADLAKNAALIGRLKLKLE